MYLEFFMIIPIGIVMTTILTDMSRTQLVGQKLLKKRKKLERITMSKNLNSKQLSNSWQHTQCSQDRFSYPLNILSISNTVFVDKLYSKTASVKHILIAIIYLSSILTILGGCVQLRNPNPASPKPPLPSSTPDHYPRWNLVFDDEFDESSLDVSKWNIENRALGGYRNCCLAYGMQYYTPKAISISNGYLQIKTDKNKVGGYSFTSGAITTENKFSFLYGRVDIRAKLPKTQGFWPALWLLPNGSSASPPFEIDMMELLGNNPTTVSMANHWDRQQNQRFYTGPDFSQTYHVFSIVWDKQTITWYIDHIQRFHAQQGISNQNMYIIINSCLGGSWSGPPNATTILPQYMDIDYVRVYQPT
jgi:hypothetical protein